MEIETERKVFGILIPNFYFLIPNTMVSVSDIKQLRDETGLSMMQCKQALEKSGGDKGKALAELTAMGAALAGKKGDRLLGSAALVSYIHSTGKVGVLLELSCETDFVAGNDEFKALARDIAMHVAAMRPTSKEELAAQAFIKDGERTIAQLIQGAVQKFGENTAITRCSWYVAHGEGATF